MSKPFPWQVLCRLLQKTALHCFVKPDTFDRLFFLGFSLIWLIFMWNSLLRVSDTWLHYIPVYCWCVVMSVISSDVFRFTWYLLHTVIYYLIYVPVYYWCVMIYNNTWWREGMLRETFHKCTLSKFCIRGSGKFQRGAMF